MGQLEALADSLIEDILATSDEDILAEAVEDYGDLEAVASRTRGVFEEALRQAKKPA